MRIRDYESTGTIQNIYHRPSVVTVKLGREDITNVTASNNRDYILG